jgi:hypothetical protein
MELDITTCPDCGLPAEVLDRFHLGSTDGAVEHVKVRCVTGHWFVTPAGYRRAAAHVPAARTARSRTR